MSIIKYNPKNTDVYNQRHYYTQGDNMLAIEPLIPVIYGFRDFYRCAVEPGYTC